MPFELGMLDVMDYLWEKMEKTPEGAIKYTPEDVDMLWEMGFVDTQKYPLDMWRSVFDPFRQADGTYLMEKDAFLSLETYRYKGEIHVPFDAMKINEGLYTDEGLQDLIDASIAPSCSYTPEKLREFFHELKELFRTPDSLIKIVRDAKIKIRDLISNNPSPLRNLELLFDMMVSEGKGKELEEQVVGSETERVTARAALEASHFTAIPTSRSEAASRELTEIVKARKKSPAVKAEGEDVALKKIRRSRKGMRG